MSSDTGLDLDLNTDIINDSDTTYESLLDKYKIDLFSNKHMELKKKQQDELNLKQTNILQNVFLDKSNVKNDKEEYENKLFQQPMVIVKQQEYGTVTSQYGGTILAGAVIIIVFVILFARYFSKRRKKRIMEDTYESGTDQTYD